MQCTDIIEKFRGHSMAVGISVKKENFSKFKEKYGINPIYCYRLELDQLVRDDLVEVDDDFIKLTKRGIDLANLVWEKFV